MDAEQRAAFDDRRNAVELYLSGASVASIKTATRVDRRQIYRLLDRCLMLHEDGRIWGWRGVVPYARTSHYRRTAALEVTREGAGAAGAFNALLQAYPGLQDWIAQVVRQKRVSIDQISTDDGLKTRLRNLKPLHLDFLKQCRALDLSGLDYPFNTERMGIR